MVIPDDFFVGVRGDEEPAVRAKFMALSLKEQLALLQFKEWCQSPVAQEIEAKFSHCNYDIKPMSVGFFAAQGLTAEQCYTCVNMAEEDLWYWC